MKNKLIVVLILFSGLACKKAEVKNSNLLWAEHIQTILPLEKSEQWGWEGSDYTNAKAKFDDNQIISSITKGLLAGKIKAYANYPYDELTINEVSHILVQWDSTAECEDPNNPGTFISCPVKSEITGWDVPQIQFHEKIELDTINYTLTKTLHYATLYTHQYDNKPAAIIGLKKLFDVKFN